MSNPLVPSEDQEQTALFEWADRQLHRYPVLGWMHMVPNGVRCSIRQAQKLKAMGLKPGVSDTFLPCAVGGYNGLYIEMKRRKKASISREQRAFAGDMARQGYLVKFTYGWEQAVVEIEAYLNGVYQRMPNYTELPRGFGLIRYDQPLVASDAH